MKWSVKIGELLGIDVYLHFTFLLLLAGSQQDFPVLENKQPAGILRRNDLVNAAMKNHN